MIFRYSSCQRYNCFNSLEISFVLSHHNLDVQNIRGQRYDGASNIRGEWNGLQALFINDCFLHIIYIA